jgi:hypothetical protein
VEFDEETVVDRSLLTTPKFWYGRHSRRSLLGTVAAGTASFAWRLSDGFCYALIANGNGMDLDGLGRSMIDAESDWGTGSPL